MLSNISTQGFISVLDLVNLLGVLHGVTKENVSVHTHYDSLRTTFHSKSAETERTLK